MLLQKIQHLYQSLYITLVRIPNKDEDVFQINNKKKVMFFDQAFINIIVGACQSIK